MTMQFLASVRRNQRQWMVVITIMSIFAFLVDDVRGANRLSGGSTALFFAVLCAAGMSIIGYPRGHTVMYGLVGFFVGGAAAWVGTTYAGPKAPVQLSIGNLTEQKLHKLRENRTKVTQFLVQLARKTDPTLEPQVFDRGDISTPAMTQFAIWRHEADRLGVSVSDEGVTEFLRDFTNKKLLEKNYLEALKEAGLGESELFSLIRGELEVQLAQRLLSPPAAGVKAIFQQPRRVALATPQQRWEDFRKMNVREALTAVAIPVAEFVKPELIAEPSDSELREYFDKRKNFFGDERGNPGFLERPKAKLAYLKASDLEAFEKGLPPVTDQEIVDYYNEHLREYRILDIPDSPGSGTPGDGAADATVPANVELPGPGPSDPPPLDTKATDKPAVDLPKQEEKVEPPKDEEKPKEEPKCGDDEVKKADEADKKDPAVEEKPAEEKAAEEKKEPSPASEKGELPPGPAVPANPGAGEGGPPMIAVPGPMSQFPDPHLMPPVRYRELNADLKLEISEHVLSDKAKANMSAAADKAFDFMLELHMKYLGIDEKDQKQRDKLTATFEDQLKAYAEKHHLEYHETKEMTEAEFATSLDERIGDADESVGASRRPRKVYQMVFEKAPNGRTSRSTLFAPQRADAPLARYSYWKIAEIPERVPDLANKETRQLVLDSWKFEKARGLAEIRAKELAEKIRKAPADVSAALAGDTINGTKESPPVSVREIPQFTWLRSTSIPTMGFVMPPMESSLGGDINNPGNDFFKLVFDELDDGEVGVSLNVPRTVFYVVKVRDREGSGPEGPLALQDLQHRFMREPFGVSSLTAYDYLTHQEQLVIDGRWQQNFFKQFGIVYNTTDAGDDQQN